MLVPLPNLDDRRWADLADEARGLIPFYAPEWTDHNVHDPGMTLVELFAWMTEAQIFRLNRIPELHRRKFLSLIGLSPRPPEAARTPLRVTLASGSPPLTIPATTEFQTGASTGPPVRFRLPADAHVIGGSMATLLGQDAGGWRELTAAWERREAIAPFGDDPRPGATFYVGLTEALPVGVPVTLFAMVDSFSSSDDERMALIEEAPPATCATPHQLTDCDGAPLPRSTDAGARRWSEPLDHHSVRIVWEYASAPDVWQRLDPAAAEIQDDTRAFTLNGAVTLRLPGPMAVTPLGREQTPRFAIRCRFAGGAYDQAPRLRDLSLNGFPIEQSVPVGDDDYPPPNALSWEIALNAQITGQALPGDEVGIGMRLDDQGRIDRLVFGPGKPRFLVIAYQAPVAGRGRLELEAEPVGIGSGFAGQRVELARAPVDAASLRLYSLETDRWRRWWVKPDFDASRASDAHVVLDPETGALEFGDGQHGRVPSKGSRIVAVYRSTRAAAGNVSAGAITAIAATKHNDAVLSRIDPVTGQPYRVAIEHFVANMTNPLPAASGSAAETVGQAEARAVAAVARSERVVTLADYETLARQTPGVRLARVSARANLYPAIPCLRPPGVITVIVLPYLPQGKPSPSVATVRAVTRYLRRRRVIGTRVEVVGPTYRVIAIRARLKSHPGVAPDRLAERAIAALDRWFDPIAGGPDGAGWPFGRDVYRSEVLQLLDGVPGVDHVLSLELLADGCAPTCANVCLGAFGLVDSGRHEVEVV
jgi:hypothetical protein